MAFFSFLPWKGTGKPVAGSAAPKRGRDNIIPAAPATGARGYATGGPSPIGVAGQHSTTGALDVEANSAFLLGTWTPVSSSWLEGLSYEVETQTLTVDFRSGNKVTTIEYPDVDPDTALHLLTAPSKGQWINRNFKKTGKAYRVVGSAKLLGGL